MNLSQMKDNCKTPEDHIQVLYRYIAHQENRINELERRQHSTVHYFSNLFRKINILRRRFDGFPALTTKQETSASRKGERREKIRAYFHSLPEKKRQELAKILPATLQKKPGKRIEQKVEKPVHV